MKLHRNLIKGGITLLITFNVYNLLNFIYQIIMARTLSVSDYGILATLFSLIYVLSIFSESIQTIMTKYSSNQNDSGKLKGLAKKSLSKGVLLGFAIFIVYALISLFLTKILEINYSLLIITGLFIPLFILSPINRGIMLGKQKFRALGFNLILEATLKILFAVILVYAGTKVYGAIGGTIIASVVAFIFSFRALKDIFGKKEKRAEAKGIYSYSLPVIIVLAAVLIFYSLDIVIAKALFSADTAGAYAIASVIAKSLFLATQPIGRAMFPIAAKDKKTQNKSSNLLKNSLLLLGICLIIVLTIFYFFPDLIVLIFSGKHILEASNILFNVTIAIAILSITNLILLYKLSKNYLDPIKLLIAVTIALVLQALILYASFAINQTINMFSNGLILSSIIFLIASFVIGRR